MDIEQQSIEADRSASAGQGDRSGAVVANGATSGSIGSLLEAPRYLTEPQARIFSELVGVLHHYKMLEEPDRPALAELAQLLDETRTLTRDIREVGFTYTRTTSMGEEIRLANPSVAIREKIAGRAWAMIKHFGMTPMARRGYVNPAADQSDWLQEFGILD